MEWREYQIVVGGISTCRGLWMYQWIPCRLAWNIITSHRQAQILQGVHGLHVLHADPHGTPGGDPEGKIQKMNHLSLHISGIYSCHLIIQYFIFIFKPI
jgi:hypothetical protein